MPQPGCREASVVLLTPLRFRDLPAPGHFGKEGLGGEGAMLFQMMDGEQLLLDRLCLGKGPKLVAFGPPVPRRFLVIPAPASATYPENRALNDVFRGEKGAKRARADSATAGVAKVQRKRHRPTMTQS